MLPKLQGNRPVSSTKSGVYLHFPYCLQKCHYCDFYSVGLDELADSDFDARLKSYEMALSSEIQARASDALFSGQTYDSIFFGGGTSSLMPPSMILRILELLRSNFRIEDDCEITLEGNPENLRPDYLNALADIGINRVNSGLQTYNAAFLKDMNRFFDTRQYDSLLRSLTESKIHSVGVDLIYGFAGQTFQEFETDLRAVLAWPIQHLSVYSLTVEPDTRYARHIRKGSQSAPNASLQEQIFENLPIILADHGFLQYEVSNYAKDGQICRHNWKYWDYRPYLGLGPGAHGFNGKYRYANPRNLQAWTSRPDGAATDSELHDPVIDLLLNQFRIALPISLQRIREVWEEQNWENSLLQRRWNALLQTLRQFEREGLGELHSSALRGLASPSSAAASASHIEKSEFLWHASGMALLDSNIERLVLSIADN